MRWQLWMQHHPHNTFSKGLGEQKQWRAMGALQDPHQAPSSVPRVRAHTFLPPDQSGPWSMWELWSGEKECQSRISLPWKFHGVCHVPSSHPFPYVSGAWKCEQNPLNSQELFQANTSNHLRRSQGEILRQKILWDTACFL